MNIGTIKKYLAVAKKDLPVQFDFCNCRPVTVSSWRGIYAEPTIGWSTEGETTVDQFLTELNLATSGKIYEGWKGGDFQYDDNSPLHVDNPGRYTLTEIVAVEVTEWDVILHTRYSDD
jgi:hypothetical protein